MDLANEHNDSVCRSISLFHVTLQDDGPLYPGPSSGSFLITHPLILHSNKISNAEAALQVRFDKYPEAHQKKKVCNNTILFMSLSRSLSPQVTTSSQNPISGTQKLRRVASKMLQKMKLPEGGKADIDLEELGSTGVQQAARFVTFTRPAAEAPQIVSNLKAMMTTRSIRPRRPARIYTEDSTAVPRSQADLNGPELRLQKSFQTSARSPTETGTPLRRNPQQVFVFEATSDRSASAVLDDVVVDYYVGYEPLDDDEDDEGSDVDWSLLDLPENVYGRLANESCHSLI
ncbi:MAG: hypothetical protein ALECFALPRED_002031 [Alectoria fallacina]|uniref:Uncharacterized protein n=1 Tax=Alectoria fallacina TaxID=1903189 RepID=A0A8H3FBA6_9LECA|nr:MAG: hypothetical protein ALECFALPRED_002031 [Alectoria fallacina]